MINNCYREEQREHLAKEYDKVAVNSNDNFAIIEKNDNKRDVFVQTMRKSEERLRSAAIKNKE